MGKPDLMRRTASRMSFSIDNGRVEVMRLYLPREKYFGIFHMAYRCSFDEKLIVE